MNTHLETEEENKMDEASSSDTQSSKKRKDKKKKKETGADNASPLFASSLDMTARFEIPRQLETPSSSVEEAVPDAQENLADAQLDAAEALSDALQDGAPEQENAQSEQDATNASSQESQSQDASALPEEQKEKPKTKWWKKGAQARTKSEASALQTDGQPNADNAENTEQEQAQTKAKEKSAPIRLKKDSFFFYLIYTFVLAYLGWRVMYTMPVTYGLPSLIFGVLLWICETFIFITNIVHFQNSRNVVIPEMPSGGDDLYPSVDVLIATHDEPVEMLFKTIQACKNLQYPDKSLVRIILCDDDIRSEMKELAQHTGIDYLCASGNKLAKGGNLNFALANTNSMLVAVFNADAMPKSDFLMETVPYFALERMVQNEDGTWRQRTEEDGPYTEKEIAFVQTHQGFYLPDPFQKNLSLTQSIPSEQDYFNRSVNVARMHTNSAVFTGSGAVFSRRCLGRSGGFATHSLCTGFATSVNILNKGYRGLALPKQLCHARPPEDFKAMMRQRHRWHKGILQSIFSRKFWEGEMTGLARFNLLLSLDYWQTYARRLLLLCCPILYGVFGIHVASVKLISFLLLCLPCYALFFAGVKQTSGFTTSVTLNGLYETILFPYLVLSFLTKPLFKQRENVITPKRTEGGKWTAMGYAVPHIILLALSLFTVLRCLREIFIFQHHSAYLILLWAIYNAALLGCAIFFYAGQAGVRLVRRVSADYAATLTVGENDISARVVNISETGLGILTDFPEYIPYDKPTQITLKSGTYSATVSATVIHARMQQDGKSYYYGLTLDSAAISEDNWAQYCQMLYDRETDFAKKIEDGFLSRIPKIYRGLLVPSSQSERKLARIILDTDANNTNSESGDAISLCSFNYQYISIRALAYPPQRLSLLLPNDFTLRCRRASDDMNPPYSPRIFYSIDDWDTIAETASLRNSLVTLLDGREITPTPASKRGEKPFVYYV